MTETSSTQGVERRLRSTSEMVTAKVFSPSLMPPSSSTIALVIRVLPDTSMWRVVKKGLVSASP